MTLLSFPESPLHNHPVYKFLLLLIIFHILIPSMSQFLPSSRRLHSLSFRNRPTGTQQPNRTSQHPNVIDLTDSQDGQLQARNLSPSPTLSPSPGLAARLQEAKTKIGKDIASTPASNHLKTPSPLKRKRDTQNPGPEDIAQSIETPQSRNREAVQRTILGPSTPVIDLVDDSDEEIEVAVNQPPVAQNRSARRRNNAIIPRVRNPRQTQVDTVSVRDLIIRLGDCVEFEDGTFMEVKKIDTDRDRAHILVGYMFTELGRIGPHMPTKRDAMVWKVDEESRQTDNRLPRYWAQSRVINEIVQRVRTFDGENLADVGLWNRKTDDVVRLRRLRYTNQELNERNCTRIGSFFGTVAEKKQTGLLTTRWRDTVVCGEDGKWKSQSLERQSFEKADKKFATSNDEQQIYHAGESRYIRPKQQIDAIDACCGIGGVSCAAKLVGFKIFMSFDFDGKKIAAYKANFPGCESMVMEMFDFIREAERNGWTCDVLHISPPCQPYSPANTSPNEEMNEINQAVLLACGELAKVLKARVVTIEQTLGLLNRHKPWFGTLLHLFTQLGFSIRWTKLKAVDFGLPQTRVRLIIIAAAPGEPLPPFPEPMKSPDEVSLKAALENFEQIRSISRLTHHDVTKVFPVPKPPHSDRLAKTVTCGGGETYHPNGKRNFTIRELLSVIQGFPLNFKILDTMYDENMREKANTLTEQRKGIGNAVPPPLMEAVYREIERTLRANDERRLGINRREEGNGEIRNVIQLD